MALGGPDEGTPLVDPGRLRRRGHGEYANSSVSSYLSYDEDAPGSTVIGQRIPYNAYTTIDWLHDLIQDSLRYRTIKSRKGLRGTLLSIFEDWQGWITAILVGIITASVAFLVDNAESSFGDLKFGICKRNILLGREACCDLQKTCDEWQPWSENFVSSFAIYAAVAWLLALCGGLVTLLTRQELPAYAGHDGEVVGADHDHEAIEPVTRKSRVMYMAAGSGIPEIKLVMSGFEFPNLLGFKVLVVKSVGAALAVASGLCLGKEGPFVHISTSAGYVVARLFPQFRENGRKLREVLSVACSSALTVVLGSPVGGVLFVYEEMSSHFPRKVLWQAFLCSLTAAIGLKFLDPSRTGRLVLLETDYGVKDKPGNYVFFILLGVCGGLFGAGVCKGSLLWNKHAKKYVDNHPLLEISGLVLVTALLQYPNPITREPSLLMIKSLLTDCDHHRDAWICAQEEAEAKKMYYIWLAYGSAVKIIMTTLTAGARIPSGLIVPALAAGAILGRLVGQLVSDTSAGIFAMVGASAFLAGVFRMTVSLTVIMFELTGEVEYIPPFMIAILTAKVVVDALHEEGINDHTVLGEYLEHELAARIAQRKGGLAGDLITHSSHMSDMTLQVTPGSKISKHTLSQRLHNMQRHGLRDAALVIIDDRHHLQGIISEAEVDYVVHERGKLPEDEALEVLFGPLASFIDKSPMTLSSSVPLEMVVEVFYELGLRHAVVLEEGSSRVQGVILKQHLTTYLERLRTS